MTFKLPYRSSIPFKYKLLNFFWSFFNSFIFPLTFRSNNLRCLILVCFGAKISKNVRISMKCKIDYPHNIEIAENSSIGKHCYLQGLDKIFIGSNVCISDKASILTGTHIPESSSFQLTTSEVKIFNNVWLAYDSCILPGVTINEGSIVGAKSLVTKNVESHSIVGGNPAVFIKMRNFDK